MAVNNRDEATAQVIALIVPTITNALHIDMLNDNIVNSAVFRKDVIDSAPAPVANAVTADFVSSDTVLITTTGNLAISFSGLENGDVKYIVLTKNATNAVAFTGATDLTEQTNFVDTVLTSVLYQIYSKNGVIYAKAVNNTLLSGTSADMTNNISYKYIAPSRFNSTTETIKEDIATATNWTYTSRDAIRQFSGANTANNKYLNSVSVRLSAEYGTTATINTNVEVGTMPASYTSSFIVYVTGSILVGSVAGSAYPTSFRVNTDGVITARNIPVALSSGDFIQLNCTFYDQQT
jgi:hypothetical protein